MNRYKLGRLPATRPFGLKNLSVYAQGKLPAPPASVPLPSGSNPEMGDNDTIGDCTIAGANNLIGIWNAVFDQTDQRPSDTLIESTYFGLTGGQDTGLNEANVLQVWQQTGLFGNKIRAYAPVDPSDVVGMHQAIAFYGGVYLGIACPESAQEQFQNSQPWTYDPSSPIEGGHCIVGGGYDAGGVWCETWGGVAYVTYPFLAHYCEEVWCPISNELVEAGGDAFNLDLDTLDADLAAI